MHVRHCVLYEFNQNAKEANKAICSAYSEYALDERISRNWFAQFRAGDRDLNDKEQIKKPVEVNDKFLEELLEEDPRQSSKELASNMSVSHTTVLN